MGSASGLNPVETLVLQDQGGVFELWEGHVGREWGWVLVREWGWVLVREWERVWVMEWGWGSARE